MENIRFLTDLRWLVMKRRCMMSALFWRETLFGKMGIVESDGFLTHLFLPGTEPDEDYAVMETGLIRTAFSQLEAYFHGELKVFDVPLRPTYGTVFMRRVWDALSLIPYGETCSYRDIALSVNNPKAVRAVGMANHRNPLPIVVPCHRVIGANGALTGYGGGLDLKVRLLELEKRHAGF